MKKSGGSPLIDMAVTGLSGNDMDHYSDAAIVEADTTIEADDHGVISLGDVWLLGKHRLACGDSTDANVVNRAIGDGKPPILMCTDPPYGVDYDANWRNEALRTDGSGSVDRAVGTVSNDLRSDWREAWALFPGDVAYVWHADRHAKSVQESLEVAGFEIRNQIIWAKTRFVIGRGNYHWQHEPCWYAVRKGKTSNYQGRRDQTTLWNIEHLKSDSGHSTQKPIECMRRPILNNTAVCEVVYEPFCGSGTTLLACEMTGRQCRAIELSPLYCYITIQRWQRLTGQLAHVEATGETVTDIIRHGRL